MHVYRTWLLDRAFEDADDPGPSDDLAPDPFDGLSPDWFLADLIVDSQAGRGDSDLPDDLRWEKWPGEEPDPAAELSASGRGGGAGIPPKNGWTSSWSPVNEPLHSPKQTCYATSPRV